MGTSAGQSGTQAFIWDEENGLCNLKAVMMALYNLPVGAWQLYSAHAISADGRTIVGYGINPDGHGEAWMAYLP